MNDVIIEYVEAPNLSVGDFKDVLIRSTLSERRPVDREEILEGMLRHADVIVVAKSGSKIVGVSRAITDFSFCTYLSDLAVDVDFQKLGIGKTLIDKTHELAGLHTTLLLLAAPAAREYYPRIGMEYHDSCWLKRPCEA